MATKAELQEEGARLVRLLAKKDVNLEPLNHQDLTEAVKELRAEFEALEPDERARRIEAEQRAADEAAEEKKRLEQIEENKKKRREEVEQEEKDRLAKEAEAKKSEADYVPDYYVAPNHSVKALRRLIDGNPKIPIRDREITPKDVHGGTKRLDYLVSIGSVIKTEKKDSARK